MLSKNNIKEIILTYIIEEFSDNNEVRRKHYSYCLFPSEECICKKSSEIKYDTRLIEGGFLTSFSIMSIVVFLENKFNIKIPEKELFPGNFNIIDDMVELVIKYQK